MTCGVTGIPTTGADIIETSESGDI